MSKALIEKLRAQRDADRASAESILSKIESGSELSDGEQKNLDDLTKSATDLDARIRELTTTEMARMEAAALDAKFDSAVREQASAYADPKADDAPLSIGEQFTASSAFQEYISAPSGKSGLVTVKHSAFATAVSTGLPPVSRVRDAATPVMVTPLLDACGYEPVSGNAVDWIEWPVDPVPTAAVDEGATKPEADYQPVLKTGTLQKWAHSVPFTREIMEDVPRFTAMLNGALLRGLRRKAEANAGAALAGGTYVTAEGATLLEAIRVGIAEAEIAGQCIKAHVLCRVTPGTVIHEIARPALQRIDITRIITGRFELDFGGGKCCCRNTQQADCSPESQ
jgi:HK97 family phage major capsid protein